MWEGQAKNLGGRLTPKDWRGVGQRKTVPGTWHLGGAVTTPYFMAQGGIQTWRPALPTVLLVPWSRRQGNYAVIIINYIINFFI